MRNESFNFRVKSLNHNLWVWVRLFAALFVLVCSCGQTSSAMNRLRRWIQVAWCKLGIWHHRVVHISRTRCTWWVFAFEVFRGGWWLSGRGFCIPVITLVRIVVTFFSHGEICIDRVIKNTITADQNWNDSLRTGSMTYLVWTPECPPPCPSCPLPRQGFCLR